MQEKENKFNESSIIQESMSLKVKLKTWWWLIIKTVKEHAINLEGKNSIIQFRKFSTVCVSVSALLKYELKL